MLKAAPFFVLPGLLVATSVAQAQGPEIGHKAIACIVAGKYPKMTACFRPLAAVARSRVYFKPQEAPAWYYVEMKSDAPCHAGVLPKPTKKLIDTRILYYVQVVDRSFSEAQTTEYDPIVVAKESDCKDRLPVAPISKTPPTGVFPMVPAGFSLGGGVSPLLIGAGGAAVVGGGVAVGVKGKDKAQPTPAPPTPTPPAPTPTPTVPPVVTSPPAALQTTCRAQPQAGPAPLDVAFATSPTGGTGEYEYLWTFGDGTTAPRSNPTHTYTSTGTFNPVVKVTSGGQEAFCARTINVGTPAPTTFPLDVLKTGPGSGTVTSTPAGINCGSTCTHDYNAGTVVTLTAAANPFSAFSGWSGACSGTGPCTVTMDAAKSVTASFTVVTFPLSVSKAGTGAGTVTSNPAGINCGSACTQSFNGGTVVSLTPTANVGSVFGGWSGACTGTGGCTVTMDAAKSVTATFTLANFPLNVTKSGGGTGTVASSPPGINCGATCSATFPASTVVTLTATPDPRMFFVGWTGACSGSGGCTVTMDAAKNVDAKFETTVTLTVSKETGAGFGTVTSNPAGINCPGTCGFQAADFARGTNVTLTATPDVGSTFTGWTMDCASAGASPTCMLTLTANMFAGARFDAILSRESTTTAAPQVADWTSQLEVPRGRGQVAVNGQVTLSATAGVARATMPTRRGENRVEAWLTEASGPGSWRFELHDLVEPGSLSVQAGQVLVVTGDSLAFKMSGKAGERVAFTFRRRSAPREEQR